MKRKYGINFILGISAFLFSMSSCTDWLEVKMEDGIMENTLFSTNEGYMTALNGVYTELNNIYGSTLSMGMIDIMAQYYNVANNNDHAYINYATYAYSEDNVESASASVWSNMYSLIANTNVLLEHCDASDAGITSKYYPIVKGEALALRAMMHFDLLRLYGPIYNESSASTLCMPYQETSKKDIQPLLSARDVLDKVIRDLESAAELLKEDPIITEGVKDAEASDDGLESYDFSYRQLRLNYYAVKALLARAYLWKGDKEAAYKIAKNDIIDKITTTDLTVFPWTTKEAVEMTDKEDRIFSSEVFFSLYNMKRKNLYDTYFDPSITITSRLTFVGSGIASSDSKVASFYDDDNDYRKKMWSVETSEEESGVVTALCFNKYKEITGTSTYRYMIPLIRLSEVYLIAAECTDDLDEALGYINELRLHRNCANTSATVETIQDVITKEFAREMIGEGQLFFYYKRHAMEQIISGVKSSEKYDMLLSDYVWPLPKIEQDERY